MLFFISTKPAMHACRKINKKTKLILKSSLAFDQALPPLRATLAKCAVAQSSKNLKKTIKIVDIKKL